MRAGSLSSRLYQFTRHGPETKFVYETEKSVNGNVVFTTSPSPSTNSSLIAKRSKIQKIEKFSNSEVCEGIERNAASRQAILEHFLKYFDEGGANEQSEFIALSAWLWRRVPSGSTDAIIATDNVQDADALIMEIFNDKTRARLVRMTAAQGLADTQASSIQTFMLGIVTNHVPDDIGDMEWTLLNRALYQLKLSGNINALAVLKSQTNGPSWKLEKIEKTAQSIENRLGSSSVRD
ncbi:MAG: hypothetical protein GX804_08220 [Lentisphaerae bacterium]|nr:hypothetical protein [Lentisphaerota bacterium]